MLPFPLIVSVLFSVVVNARAFEESREFKQTGVEVEGTPIEKSMVQGGQGAQMNQGHQGHQGAQGAQMQRPIQPMNQQYSTNQYSNSQAPHNQYSPSHNQQHPPIFQYPHQSGITTPDDPTDPYLLHADPWCTVDDPFADGALEALIADMDRKSRPEREQGEYGIPTMNEFARARQKSGRRARTVEDDDESMDGQQQMLGAYSPFHSVMDYNCPNGDPYAADDEDESSSSASGYYYHHPAPPPPTKSRRSRRSASSKSISRLLDTLNNQPTNPFADQRKSRKSRRTTGRPESRMSRRSVSRPGSVNSMITMDGTAKNLKNKKDKSKLKLKSKLKSKKHTQNQNKNKKNINGGRK